jgi:hypothetical protein
MASQKGRYSVHDGFIHSFIFFHRDGGHYNIDMCGIPELLLGLVVTSQVLVSRPDPSARVVSASKWKELNYLSNLTRERLANLVIDIE